MTKIFTQSNIKGSFDEVSITTGRIWQEDDTYYMTYGGGNKFGDYPIAFGLAKSKDLFNWTRYPSNPILPITAKKSSIYFLRIPFI